MLQGTLACQSYTYENIMNARCRNSYLADHGVKLPNATSTGTTIVGCLFEDGIVLGADTRATAGPIVADKNCEKVRMLRCWSEKC